MRLFVPAFIVFVILMFVGIITFNITNVFHESTETFTVTDKSVTHQDKEVIFMIFTNKTTYQVSDTLIYRRWDSADVYGKIQVGKTYRAKLQGYRVPFLSMLPNIVEIEEVTPEN